MDELEPGARIERYVVEEKLGEGGMAAVYRVRHQTLGTLHALKILTIGGKKIRQRLVHEGRVQAMLDHPNVVAVRDVLDVDGSPGLLMDFVDGPDLETWLRERRPELDEAEAVFRQIVGAVRAAHRHGLVHRDLKPANVLMRQRSTGEWQAKVADFGLAKALEEGSGSMTTTRTGTAMGTPAFMAPEQIRDASSVDHRADIWALGCILYEMSTGEIAFDGQDIVEVFNAVTDGAYVAPERLRPEIPGRFSATIMRCLTVDPDKRLRSCEAVLASLDGDEDPESVQRTWEGDLPSPVPPPDSQPPHLRPDTEPPLRPPVTTPPLAARAPEPVATPRPAPTRLGWAIPLIAAFLLGGGSLLTVLGIVWAAATWGPSSGIFGCAGWTKAGIVFTRRSGQEWVLTSEKEVVTALPGESNGWKPGDTACTLPAGTRITLLEDPTRLGRAGIWVRIQPDNVVRPPPKDGEPPPDAEPAKDKEQGAP